MESSDGKELCNIQCPNCGIEFTKDLEWLGYHRSYKCQCGAIFDALEVHTKNELKLLDSSIRAAKDILNTK